MSSLDLIRENVFMVQNESKPLFNIIHKGRQNQFELIYRACGIVANDYASKSLHTYVDWCQ